jgi:DNA end-binding protein Ku
MARQLVESLSAKWEPAKYTDEYKENLMRVIKGKLKGKAPRLKERESHQQADVIDLMSRLRASLEGRGQKGEKSGGAGSGAAKGRKTAAAGSKRTGSRTTARKRRVA